MTAAAATLAKAAKNKWFLILVAVLAITTFVYQSFSKDASTKPWFSTSFISSQGAASSALTATSSGSPHSRDRTSVVVEELSPVEALSSNATVSLSQATPPEASTASPPILAPSPSLPLRLDASPLVASPSPSLESPPPNVSSTGLSSAAPPPTSIASLTPNLANSPPPLAANDTKIAIAGIRKQVPEWRLKIEQELRQAKQEIQAATAANVKLELTKSLYLNVYKFQKSYELMEKIFKVYMYKEGKPNLVHRGPQTGIYASEGWFIHEMNHNTQFVTEDPQAAYMYFLPYSVSNMVVELYVPGSHSMLPLATFIKNYVNQVASLHPFWNMTKGSDHFFVSCHDWGPATARDHPELRKNAVKVVCNADLTEEFVLSKDVSLLETYVHSLKPLTRLGGPGPSRRPILAFFAGQLHGRVRPVLLQYWKDKDPDMKIYEKLPRDIAKRMSYEQHMKASKYCICAMGYEVNSPRIVESIYYDCVPVLIADNFVLPFSDVLNWSAFSVTIAEADIPRLKEILLSIPEASYRKMQERLKKVRKHFVWHDRAEKYDAFHMILHSVWLSRLQQLDNIARLEQEQLETGV